MKSQTGIGTLVIFITIIIVSYLILFTLTNSAETLENKQLSEETQEYPKDTSYDNINIRLEIVCPNENVTCYYRRGYFVDFSCVLQRCPI